MCGSNSQVDEAAENRTSMDLSADMHLAALHKAATRAVELFGAYWGPDPSRISFLLKYLEENASRALRKEGSITIDDLERRYADRQSKATPATLRAEARFASSLGDGAC
jgi:hypothetical protein